MTRILLIESTPGEAQSVCESLAKVPSEYEVDTVDRLSPVLTGALSADYDVILCDLSLPDSVGLDTFHRVRSRFPDLPIVFLADVNDETRPLLSGRSTAQDLVTKKDLSPELLRRTISYAIERQQAVAGLLEAGYRDDLTGLLNRGGFLELAEQEMARAARANRALVLMLCDVTWPKQTDDQQEGGSSDAVLREAAEVLRTTFRKTDILARIDGGQFVVLAPEEDTDRLRLLETKLQENIEAHNRRNRLPYPLLMTSGTVAIHSGSIGSLLAVLQTAEHSIDSNQLANRTEDLSFDAASPALNP